MSRRRFETQALVGELKRERRSFMWLALAATAVLGFLGLYVTLGMGTTAVPTVPLEAQAPAPAPVAAPRPVAPPPVVASAAPAAPASNEAVLNIELPTPASLWINGKLIGDKVKTHTQKLPPGTQHFRTKVGRKDVRHSFDAEAGKTYKAALDAKKKKWQLEAAR